MANLKLDKKYLKNSLNKEILNLTGKLEQAFNDLHLGRGHCQKDNGWVNYTKKIEEKTIKEIIQCAEYIKTKEALIVIGIGGSYLGAKAVINALTHNFSNQVNRPQIYFAGQNVDPTYLAELIEVVKNKDVVINVISKSGTTLETLLAFRILKEELVKKHGKKIDDKIIVTTDATGGSLRKFADENNLKSFIVPDNVGGRYSVLTPVGLLPIAASGVDITKLLLGANALVDEYSKFNVNHPYIEYAAIRYLLNHKGKDIEILIYYQEKLRYLAEWYKQLFAESEGKEGKGVFPTSLMFSTDLHSFGQLIQNGKQNFFETSLKFRNVNRDLTLRKEEEDLGGLNYLEGYKLSDVLNCVQKGTLEAHRVGGAPNLMIDLDELNEFNVGQLIYFFEKSCAISALLNNVNPFDQPGVEKYKENVKRNLKLLCGASKK
ncbi:MAG: glucose-6-phosphate isomerase [Clostridia bacterium]